MKKGIIITFFIISLVLIGMMFLIVDVRNNPIDDFTTLDNEFKSVNLEEKETNTDSLTAKLKSQKDKSQSQELEKFNNVTEDILAHIEFLQEKLFPGGIEAHDLGESPKVKENNALFFKKNGVKTEIAIQLIAKLDTFENNMRALQLTFPEIKTITPTVRDKYTNGLSWLDYNFKDFPAIASHVKLKLLADNIKSKREEIFANILANE